MTPTGGQGAARASGSASLLAAGAALVVAALLALTVEGIGSRLARDPLLLALIGYLAYWVPLAAATWASWKRSARAAHPFPVRPLDIGMDIGIGVGAGLVARAVAILVELAVYGRPLVAGAQPTIDGVGPSPALVALTMVVAPLAVAPVVEEWFFRGTLLPALRTRGHGAPGTAVAVIASALIFALMHLLVVSSVTGGVVTGLSALALGLATGILAVRTGRLVAPVVAHVMFNATVLIPALL